MGHYFIAPEHLFLAMVHAEDSASSQVLSRLGCDMEQTSQIIEKIIEHIDPGVPQPNMPLTRSTESVLRQSLLISRARNSDTVEERDVMLSMLQHRQGIIALALEKEWEIGYEEVRAILD